MITVLYVDDEPDLLELGRLFLEATGDFSVTTQESADAALALLKIQSFDLVLSDYSMPDMDGIAFLKAIRSVRSEIPFILFTGRGREEVVVEAINNGADFYIQKGGDIRSQFSELAHKIRHAVMRKRAEAELAESREYLSRIFASVKAGIIVIDAATHTIIDLNPTAAELIGLPKGDIIGRNCHSYICPAETGKCPILDLGQNVDNSERVLLSAKGARIPIIKYVTRVKLSGRDCLLETFIDNTERRRAEDELRAAYEELKQNREENVAAYSELAANEQVLISDYARLLEQERNLRESAEQYRTLFESANDAIFLLEKGIFYECNERTLAIFGCTEKSQVIGHSPQDFMPEFQPDGRRSSERVQEYDRTVLSGTPITFEIMHLRQNGTPFYASVSLNRVVTGDHIRIQSIVRDISDSKQVEKAMVLANRKLHMLNEVTRHEIRNIVTGLVGSMDMARTAASDVERDMFFRQKKELIAALQKQLDFTEDYEKVGVDTPKWQQIQPLIPSFSSIVTTLSPEVAGLEIYGDPLMEKVFVALAENSVRHGGHASALTIRTEEHGHELSLLFEDDGRGVPEDMKEEIFRRRIGAREGMGLFLVREILGITGITIREDGVPGRGARFSITIPAGAFRHTGAR